MLSIILQSHRDKPKNLNSYRIVSTDSMITTTPASKHMSIFFKLFRHSIEYYNSSANVSEPALNNPVQTQK